MYVNDAYAKMLGRRDVQDFMSEPDMRQYIPPSFHHEAEKLAEGFQESNGFHGWKKVYNIRTDGTPVWMEISDETVEWDQGNAVLTTAQMIDNGTTAMQVDHMLGRSFIGVMVHRNMTALYVNDAFAHLMGAENASKFMENPNVLRFIPEQNRPRALKHVAGILSGERHGDRHRRRHPARRRRGGDPGSHAPRGRQGHRREAGRQGPQHPPQGHRLLGRRNE